ncbi:LysR family transcriptional regulator [Cochlodiniinecator piscidefendens]|uniref:LysR family transcriptional regulator n=1 Tax=Cochlodiniinecator piscidefendens TaxID=2715756 RepID=UPI00140E11FB|nr:LysR family transcriptional regulator [Cochlodiniinecator piscidefendens]
MQRSRLSLKWLEVFQLAARTGSVQAVASETGLSVSTVSHHLRSLDTALGVKLIDHHRRPMVLTPAGTSFLRRVDEALRQIRAAEVEVAAGNLIEARSLRLGLIDDFDAEIGPELARILANGMQSCEFSHFTRPSHEILTLLRKRKLDIGVANRPHDDLSDLIEFPLFRDPFVLAAPIERTLSAEEYLAGKSTLPFLRYANSHIIGGQISTQLRRIGITLPGRFEFESNQSIMGMIADGGGWAITTPTGFIRAKRFHKQIQLLPFPGKGFARHLSLFTTEEYPQHVAEMIATTLRRLIRLRAIEPAVSLIPWLEGTYTLTSQQSAAQINV